MISNSEEIFSFSETLHFEVKRSDFEDLGIVFEFELKPQIKGVFFLSFFSEEYVEISDSELLVITDQEAMIDDSCVIFSSLLRKNKVKFKLLNKEARYLKIKAFSLEKVIL